MNNSSTDSKDNNTTSYKNIIRFLWFCTIGGILAVLLLFWGLSNSKLPSFEELENPKYHQASEVFAENSDVFGRYYIENRVPIVFDELSPNVVQALVATEDERFYQHAGIDFEALLRTLSKNVILRNKNAGGASTITQQLAKLLFTEKASRSIPKRIVQKLKEWIIAVRLERQYTKEEIIAMYLNKFNFINGAYGISAAAEIYFNKTPNTLNKEEAATLVGMLKNPSLYNPRKRLELTQKRREVVLKQMVKNELISRENYDSLRVLPLDMSSFERKTHNDGLAPYFRMVLGEQIKSILKNKAQKHPDGTAYDLYRDGLKIFTTIDPKIQAYHEDAMISHMTTLHGKYKKHWKGKDEWEYREEETTEAEMKARKRTLNKLIFESSRARSIRAQYLDKTITAISKKIDFTLRDRDFERMLEDEKTNKYISKLIRTNMIGKKLAAKYRIVMESDDWSKVKAKWFAYRNAVKENFDEATKMKVFTYENENFEKDTTMTPLDSIKYHRSFLQVGSMSVDPKTGYVKSWVGGINHKYFQYDHVTSDRQVGSTFKPFIYATAIEQQGFSPCYQVDDIPYTIHQGEGNFNLKEDWTPQNSNGEYTGEIYSLFRGLQQSKNTVSVYLMKEIGAVNPVRELAKSLGFNLDKIPPAPSICLGSADLSVMDMTGAYSTFANNGLHNKPVFIKSIQDKYGRVIYKDTRQENRALRPETNYVMVQMLNRIVSPFSPGFSGVVSNMGGKTGTTNDYVDGWFMGVTPDLVVGTWVGGENRWIRFRTIENGQGARMARPVFANLLKRLEADEDVDYDKTAQFTIPPGDLGIVINCDLYEQARGGGNSDDDDDDDNEGFGDSFGDELDDDENENTEGETGEGGEEEEEEPFGDGFN